MSQPDLGRLKYNFIHRVADLVLEHGVIFGGYVRDTIIHNHFADRFYETHAAKDNFQSLYEDVSCDVDTLGRLLIPEDIDCFMTSGSLEKFIGSVKKTNKMKIVRRRDVTVGHRYTDIIQNKVPLGLMLTKIEIQLMHNTLYMDYLPKNLLELSVKLDVLHAPQLENKEPPFCVMDFECNCLVLDMGHNIRLSKPFCDFNYLTGLPLTKVTKLQSVISDILAKKAIPVVLADHERCMKMTNKGWTVEEDGMTLLIADEDEQGDDVCPICCDNLRVQIKNSCCNSRYHPLCFAKFLQASLEDCPPCPTCRKPLYVNGMRTVMWPNPLPP